MVIKDKFLAEQFEKTTDQKNGIWWITRMDDIESAGEKYFQTQVEFEQQGPNIFHRIDPDAVCFQRHGVAVDVNIVNDFARFRGTLAFGTDYADIISCGLERACFGPHPAIKWYREVFDDDQNAGR